MLVSGIAYGHAWTHLGKVESHVVSGKRRGEDHPNRRLTERDVVTIRWLCGTHPTAAIARIFGVSTTSIRSVMSGRTWRHVIER